MLCMLNKPGLFSRSLPSRWPSARTFAVSFSPALSRVRSWPRFFPPHRCDGGPECALSSSRGASCASSASLASRFLRSPPARDNTPPPTPHRPFDAALCDRVGGIISSRAFQVGALRASCPMRSIGLPQHGQALIHGARLGGGSPGFQSSSARMRSHFVFAAGLHQPPRKRLRLTRSRDDNPRAARAGGSGAKTPASPASGVSTGPCPRRDTGR